MDSDMKVYKLTANQKRYLSWKRMLDVAVCLPACIMLFPVMAGAAALIKLDSPGPILFKQKRVGKDKELFEIWKFRTMRTDTPKDMPTHLLNNPEAYITRTGRWMRKLSVDELPQLYQCLLTGRLSLCGPRPALWNQEDLIAERDKYGANSIKPGITGWAQINGRDELPIAEKARLDGEYVKKLGLWMDIKCIFGTIGSVLSHSGVVEGSAGGGCNRKEYPDRKGDYTQERYVEKEVKKERNTVKVLITGAGSYLGTAVESWLNQENKKSGKERYQIDTLDMKDTMWKKHDFTKYDVVYHVAGIAHSDTKDASEEQKRMYYKINTKLAVDVAEKAKIAGVRQFIFMSSMIIYGGCKEKKIGIDTVPKPLNFYGDSKWKADQRVRALSDDRFRVAVLRPPMIYGRGSKGNYPELAKLAGTLPVFPAVRNMRSMLYIDNFCQFVKLIIDNEESGIFFPQNKEYAITSDMVRIIAKTKGHRIRMIPFMSIPVKLLGKIPGRLGELAKKAFGDFVYDKNLSEYKEEYRLYSLEESILQTEGCCAKREDRKKHILVVSQYFYPEQFRINDICTEWVKRGYQVTVITGIPNYPQGKFYKGYGFLHKRRETWNGISIVRIPIIPRGQNVIGLITNYLSFVLSGFVWKSLSRKKADKVFIFEVSPMTQALVGVWYAKKHKIPCSLYVQDLWPENVEIVMKIHHPMVIKPIRKMVDDIYRNCTTILATSPSLQKEIQKRCKEKKKVLYLPQYAEDLYQPVSREIVRRENLVPELSEDGRFKIIFTGNIGRAQGLEILPEAAALLQKRYGKKILFVIVGDGRNKQEFIERICQRQVEDMFLLIEGQPASRIPAFLACCEVAFVSFMENELFAKTIPAKLQSYMACGMPILASATGETERIIKEAECGISAAIGKKKELCRAILTFMSMNQEDLEKMGRNSRKYSVEHFDKKKILDRMDFVFTDRS